MDEERGEDVDAGEPIAELQSFEEEPGSGFLTRVRRRINRRILTSQAVDLSLQSLVTVVKCYVFAFFEAFQPPDKDRTEE